MTIHDIWGTMGYYGGMPTQATFAYPHANTDGGRNWPMYGLRESLLQFT